MNCINSLRISVLAGIVGVLSSPGGWAQAPSDTLAPATLTDCIQYALRHQPVLRQAVIDQAITDRTIRSALAAWYPQVGFNYSIQHYLKLPVQLFPAAILTPGSTSTDRVPITTGVANTSTLQLAVNQNIFSRDVLLANRTADVARLQARQTTIQNQINVTADVSRAFYDVIFSQRQASIINEDIARVERNLRDALNQYQSGVVDKTDSQRATITLNNTKAQRKQYQEQTAAKYQILKQAIGYPPDGSLILAYDTLQTAAEIEFDTTQKVDVRTRIEYQLLQTQRRLQEANVLYNRWAYYPTVGAFGYYNFLYQNSQFAKLYSQNFPNSYIGLNLALPIFQGGRRIHQVKIAQLQVERVDWDIQALTNSVVAEYAQALAAYKGNLANFLALSENVTLAQDVYRIITLQYRSGIRAYLDVTIAESDLRTARLSYYNALFQVLSSKIDAQRALGTIRFNP